MTRKEFVKFTETGKHVKNKTCVTMDKSVTDPSFAQTGRQLLTNPLPIEYRMKYMPGTPLNKENPMHFNEYDKMYPDTFKAIREAESITKQTKDNLDKLEKHYKDSQSSQQSTKETEPNN